MKLSEHRTVWFWSIFVCGLIPMLCRGAVYLMDGTQHYFEISELIFFGITLSVTNLASIGHLDIEGKIPINLASAFMTFFLGIFLALSMFDNSQNKTNAGIFRLIVWALIIVSVRYSFFVNDKCFGYYESSRKKKKVRIKRASN